MDNSKKLKEKIQKFLDKALLLIELPFYPFVYYFLQNKLKTKEGRRYLFLKTKGYVPLRRLLFYVLDKIFIKMSNNYTLPSYEGVAGYVLDLKFSIAHSYFSDFIFKNNYSYTFKSLKKILKESPKIVSVIDFGCGAGVLARACAKEFPNLHVTGLDIREEVMEYNSLLYNDVVWDNVNNLDSYVQTFEKNTILICNGVINFMKQDELEMLLSKKVEYIIWYYYTPVDPVLYADSKEKILSHESNDIHYNLPLFLKESNYSFEYGLIPNTTGPGFFLHAVSKYL